jgi:hypothetical protein
MRLKVGLAGGAAIVVAVVLLPVGAGSARQVSLFTTAAYIKSGQRVVLRGTAAHHPFRRVVLYVSAYPRLVLHPVAAARTDRHGFFAFTQAPDRDTTYQVRLRGGQLTSRPVAVDVDGHVRIQTRPDLGKASVRVVLSHPPDLDWDGVPVYWRFAAGKHGEFTRAPVTRTVRVRPGVSVLAATAKLPVGVFRWRACFHAPGDDQLEDPDHPPDCDGQGFSGRGLLTKAFPSQAAIARAERYLASREGHTALAVVDTDGHLSGVHLDEQFITGSVVKAMLLVAYLRQLHAQGEREVDSASDALLSPMIHYSDNKSATHVWSLVGNDGLYEVAHAAGMTHFSVPTYASWGSEWGTALLTASDQARFFFEMDSLIPREFVSSARDLLSHIAGYESWGIPAIARPLGYHVFFKAGWRPSPDTFLVHQIARLEKDGERFSVAVMTDGDSDLTYGIDTIQGATQALLG